MKMVTAIVRTTSLDRIVKSLEERGVRHLTISEIKGVGEQVQAFTPYTIHNLIQIITLDNKVDEITDVILDHAHTGLAGDGFIAVSPVEYTINIRTRERIE